MEALKERGLLRENAPHLVHDLLRTMRGHSNKSRALRLLPPRSVAIRRESNLDERNLISIRG
jgi:glycerol-3-phosphate dehydrogenase